jgi:5-methylcytosine-specific restriction protein A
LTPTLFLEEKVYRRSTIHDEYGGNRQSGISYSVKYPYIFIFSGESGHKHGYFDRWLNPDVFQYSGEGQLNDMEFIKGNLQLKDHVKNGKRVFLFYFEEKAFVRYKTELELLEYDFFIGPDTEGKNRKGIEFYFKKIANQLNYKIDKRVDFSLNESQVVYKINIPNETERKGLVTSRVGQGAYRKSILYRWQFKCAVTNYSKKEILIASHIVPWKDSTNEERLDVDNGILLSPTYDALFDQGLITFENNGKIVLSSKLASTNYYEIGVTGKEVIKNISSGNHTYLERHRKLMI